MRFLCKENVPTVFIYTDLCRKVNFRGYRKENVETAIINSLYSVVVFGDRRPIGITRIIGDGRIAFFTKNVVMSSAYQKNQIGDLLMQKPQEYPVGAAREDAYVGFMSTPNCVPFYKRHDFLEHPCDGMGLGMMKLYDPREVRK